MSRFDITRTNIAIARLLETTDLSVEQVAEAVGIASAAVLRERFRRIVGTSPQSYRRSFRPA